MSQRPTTQHKNGQENETDAAQKTQKTPKCL